MRQTRHEQSRHTHARARLRVRLRSARCRLLVHSDDVRVAAREEVSPSTTQAAGRASMRVPTDALAGVKTFNRPMPRRGCVCAWAIGSCPARSQTNAAAAPARTRAAPSARCSTRPAILGKPRQYAHLHARPHESSWPLTANPSTRAGRRASIRSQRPAAASGATWPRTAAGRIPQA